ncbi:MAG: hypothetical protein V4858_15875 [Pseudomonadota bacterium]
MKIHTKLFCELTLGVSLGLAAMTQCAHAADFNPQPDPPGRSANNTPRLHNPPADKGALVDLNDKVKKGSLAKPNERAVQGTVIGPNDQPAKGLVINPNVKKN